MTTHRMWVAGVQETSDESIEIRSPYNGDLVGHVATASADQIETAIAAAAAALPETTATSAYERSRALRHVSERITERAAEFAAVITAESGKPIMWSRAEVARAASTFGWAAEEARRWSGCLQRLDTEAASAGRTAVVRRFPRGPVLAITPFNFPLNLTAHKVAPAIAAGAPLIVKPAPATPLSALLLGELLAEADLPRGSWSVLPMTNDQAAALVVDPRLPVVSFTGSSAVGWGIRDMVPRKQVILELGGNATAVLCGDYGSGPDLRWAASRVATFATYQAGQSCISVQRVLVDRALYDRWIPLLLDEVAGLRQGDPADESVCVGPLIDHAAARRVEQWIADAATSGAKVLAGGTRHETMIDPTVLVDVPHEARLVQEEVFGPVVTIAPVDGVDEAFEQINKSRYGLQAGIFTRDIGTAFRAHRELQVGGVVIGDVPSFRADQMPYGGVKDSGTGREGIRSAMIDYTDERTLVLSGVAL